jgi:hypothetical protein
MTTGHQYRSAVVSTTMTLLFITAVLCEGCGVPTSSTTRTTGSGTTRTTTGSGTTSSTTRTTTSTGGTTTSTTPTSTTGTTGSTTRTSVPATPPAWIEIVDASWSRGFIAGKAIPPQGKAITYDLISLGILDEAPVKAKGSRPSELPGTPLRTPMIVLFGQALPAVHCNLTSEEVLNKDPGALLCLPTDGAHDFCFPMSMILNSSTSIVSAKNFQPGCRISVTAVQNGVDERGTSGWQSLPYVIRD